MQRWWLITSGLLIFAMDEGKAIAIADASFSEAEAQVEPFRSLEESDELLLQGSQADSLNTALSRNFDAADASSLTLPAIRLAQTDQINPLPQPDRNDDRFLQDPPTPVVPAEPVLPSAPEPPPPDDDAPAESQVLIPVSQVEVLGSTIFDESDFDDIVAAVEGRSVRLEELRAVADAITQLYLDRGYLTSRAVLGEQQVVDGIIRIQVIEGRLSEIQIEGLERLNESYIRERIALGAQVPLRAEDLEQQLRLLRVDPLLENIEASIRASGEVGQSILIVRVTEADPWFGQASVDNYSPPSVGSERIGVDLGYRNLTGLGDAVSFSYDRTAQNGANIFQFNYQIPVNAMNGTLRLRSVIDRNQIIDPAFEQFQIQGESELYELSFRQPLIRSTREELAFTLGFSFKDGQTFIFEDIPQPFGIGPDEDGISRTSVIRFGQDYVSREVTGAWALRSQFSLGTDWFDATVNDSPIPDSQFFSWLGQIQRVQRLSEDHLVIAQLDIQLTPDSLLSSEQFVIGGGQVLRGYRQNVRSGDNGFRFSIEDRITIGRNAAGATVLQLIPFIDMGAVWNHPDNPNQLADQTFLASVGLGLLWEVVPGLNVKLDYAVPFVDLDDRGNNAQEESFYFSLGYTF